MNRAFILPTLHQELDGERQVSLARAAEEASELVKEAMKALRFGLENRYPADGPTNAEKIVAEFRDIEAALVDAGLLRSADPFAGQSFTRVVVTDISGCARCGLEHPRISVYRLDNPDDEFGHFAICPTNGQPILISIQATA